VYVELDNLLKIEDLDFLDVLTPPALHKQHCLKALDAGLHVVCQKPIADDLNDARELVGAFERSDRYLAIHENHRYRPWFQETLRRAHAGNFGTIRFARFEQFDSREPAEPYKIQSKRGILLEYGTHLVDMLQALCGVPQSVTGNAFCFNSRVSGESLVHLTFSYPAAVACLDIAWKPSGLPHAGVVVVGDKGEAIYEGTMTRGESSRFRVVEGNAVVVDQTRSPYDDYVESFYLFQRAFTDALLGRGSLPQPAAENLQVLETTFAAYAAIESSANDLPLCTERGSLR
jgi:predicted dehydrogenase